MKHDWVLHENIARDTVGRALYTRLAKAAAPAYHFFWHCPRCGTLTQCRFKPLDSWTPGVFDECDVIIARAVQDS